LQEAKGRTSFLKKRSKKLLSVIPAVSSPAKNGCGCNSRCHCPAMPRNDALKSGMRNSMTPRGAVGAAAGA
jgi:hypothetical protein